MSRLAHTYQPSMDQIEAQDRRGEDDKNPRSRLRQGRQSSPHSEPTGTAMMTPTSA